MLQGEVATLIALLYPENGHHILAGALRIRGERESAAVSEAHVELYRDLCLAIAQQLSDLILNNKTYPWVVTIRDYEVVVFPSTWGRSGHSRSPRFRITRLSDVLPRSKNTGRPVTGGA